MVNLVPAKCPCCGGQLELDDNMKRAECKYCRNTIIVDEAIEKLKTDSQGNLKISGIKDADKYLEEASNYYKAQDYKSALDRYNSVLGLDSFNVQAFIMKIKCILGIIGDISVYDRKLKTGNEESWVYGYAIKDLFKKINTYDKVNNSKKEILEELGAKNLNKINKIIELVNSNNVKSSNKNASNYESMINDCLNNYKKFAQNKDMDRVLRFLNKNFEINSNELTKDNIKTLEFRIQMDKNDFSEIWNINYDSNNYSLVINPEKYKNKAENLYDVLKSNYEQWINNDIVNQLNNFINNSNIFTKNKKIKYLASFFGIDYTTGLEFTKIKNNGLYYRVKIGPKYEEKTVRNEYTIEKIEKYINDYK